MAEPLGALHPHPNRELISEGSICEALHYFSMSPSTPTGPGRPHLVHEPSGVKEDEYTILRELPEEPVSAWLSSLPLQAAAPLQPHTVLAMAQGSQCHGLH